MSVAVGSIRLAATSSPEVLPVAPTATAAACCDLDSWTARITKRLTKHTRAVLLEASLMIDLLSAFIFVDCPCLLFHACMYRSDSCGTPRGNLSREAAFRETEDDPRSCVRRCFAIRPAVK